MDFTGIIPSNGLYTKKDLIECTTQNRLYGACVALCHLKNPTRPFLSPSSVALGPTKGHGFVFFLAFVLVVVHMVPPLRGAFESSFSLAHRLSSNIAPLRKGIHLQTIFSNSFMHIFHRFFFNLELCKQPWFIDWNIVVFTHFTMSVGVCNVNSSIFASMYFYRVCNFALNNTCNGV